MEGDASPSKDDVSPLSPTGPRHQCDSFASDSYPSSWTTTTTTSSYGLSNVGANSRTGLSHSETSDGLSANHYPFYNQSARAWMWSRGTGKRALSEQNESAATATAGHNHLWHPPASRHSKRISAPLVRTIINLTVVSRCETI